MKKAYGISMLALICLCGATDYLQAGTLSEPPQELSLESPASINAAPVRSAAAAEQTAVLAASDRTGSRVTDKKNVKLRGAPACEIRFVYAGWDRENIFWGEPCAAVTAKMVSQRELEALGKWNRLDSFAKRFVHSLPEGKVLYVEGSFSASVYPVGTSGSTYEVPVAD